MKHVHLFYCLLLNVFLGTAISTAYATVTLVTNTSNSGPGSFRSAIIFGTDGDTVRFDPSLISSGNVTITLVPEIQFSHGVTIIGLYNATDTLFISGGGSERIFNKFSTSGLSQKMVIDSLMMINGDGFRDGGAIRLANGDTLIMRNSMIKNCTADEKGGAIYQDNSGTIPPITLINTTFIGNTANDEGGAIFCLGSLTIDGCVFRGNTSITERGGAIYQSNTSSTDFITINNSTFDANVARWGGAGISGRGATINVSHSTISNNSLSNGSGGGILSDGGGGLGNSSSVTISHSTITGNRVNGSNEGAGILSNGPAGSTVNITNSTIYDNLSATGTGNGSGIRSTASSGTSTINIQGSIISGNGTSNIYNNQSPAYISLGFNLIDTSSASLNLGPLADNGGTTFTLLPIAPSLAIDSGDPSDLSAAQNSPIYGTRDIGAAEVCKNNTGIDAIIACDSYQWIDGITYTSSNSTATFTIQNAGGCDSVITLNLSINSSSTSTDVHTACDTFLWIDGITYIVSNNTAIFTMPNANGCDSLITLDLTINNSNTGIDTQVACDEFIWTDGITYTASNNTAKDTFINNLGCDSVVTLNLTINNSNSATDKITACESYTWIDGITYTSNNNTAMDTLVNALGCDSVVTLNLTINNSNSATDKITACESYTWIDGITYTSNNNTAMDTLVNALGCDSVVTLDLTIKNIDLGVSVSDPTITANETGASYQWLDCDNGFATIPGATNQSFTAIANGRYAVEIVKDVCTDTSSCTDIRTIGISEETILSSIAIYPNPNHTGLVNIDLGQLTNVSINVFKVTGQLVYQVKNSGNAIHQFQLDQRPGVFVVQVESNGNIAHTRLVIY